MTAEISKIAKDLITSTSPIKEIFKFADVSKLKEFGIKECDFVSFCGGWVNHEAPALLKDAYINTMLDNQKFHFTGGYSPTTGEKPLKEALITFAKELYQKTDLASTNIAIGQSSSQLTLSLMHVLLNKEDKICLLDPTFLSYPMQVLSASGAKIIRYPVLDPQDYSYIGNKSDTIIDFSNFIKKHKPKIVLLVSPDNPTSKIPSDEFVTSCYESVKSYNGILIIDFAYKEIIFDDYPNYYQWVADDNFIAIHSNSKWCRGLGRRLGWIEAPENVIEAIEALQTVSVLCPDRLHQLALTDYINQSSIDGSLTKYIENMKQLYSKTAKVTTDCIEKYLKLPYIKPEGGLYVCVKVNEDSSTFVEKVFKETGVLFVAGKPFGPSLSNSVRLSYGPLVYDHGRIIDGLKRVGAYLKQ